MRLLVALLVLGATLSLILLLAGARPGIVLVPLGLSLVLVLLLAPFPIADYALAVALVATFPLVPPSGLPNLPVSAAVVTIGLIRIYLAQRVMPGRRTIALIIAGWAFLAIGVAISHWPPLSIWLRPAAILAVGFLATLLGVLVWRDEARRWRWLVGIALGLIIVAGSAFAIFALQYVAPIDAIVDSVISLQAYLRGEAAAAKFDARNNWVIAGTFDTLRAVSPLFPAPNNVGGFIGVSGPLSAALWIAGPTRRARAIGGIAVAIAVATIFVTQSRSTWMAAFAAALFLGIAIFAMRQRLRHEPRWPGVGGLARYGLVVVLAAVVGIVGVVTTANENAGLRVTGLGEDRSISQRIEGDIQAAGELQSNLLRGAGLGNWAALPDVAAQAQDPYRFTYIHNVYLQYAVAAGILGAAWVISLLAYLLVGGIVAARRRWAADSAFLGMALGAVGVFAAVQFMFDDNLLNPQYAWLLLWCVGGAVGLAWAVPVGGATRDPWRTCDLQSANQSHSR